MSKQSIVMTRPQLGKSFRGSLFWSLFRFQRFQECYNKTAERRNLAYGYRFTSDGIVADEELSRTIDWPNVFQYDWVHIMLSGGVMVHAAWNVLAACEEHGLPGQAELSEFLKGWQIPKASQFGSRDVRTLWRFFDPKSARENRKRQGVRCNASELLALSRCLGVRQHPGA